MKHLVTDLLLLVLILVGGVLAWRSGREESALRAEYVRLTQKTGELKIGDPTQVHIVAMETGDPLHFAWRIYLPPNYKQIIRHQNGSSSGSRSQAHEYIARLRFRDDDMGRMLVYSHFSSSSSRSSIGDVEVARILREHRDKIQVEQLGLPMQTTITPQGSAVLLRLSLPEAMQEAAGVTTPRAPELLKLEIGPPPAPP